MTRLSGHCIDGICDRCTYSPCDHDCHDKDES